MDNSDGGLWVGELVDRVVKSAPFWAQLTSVSSGKYAWTEQQFNTSGSLVDLVGGRSGTTSIYPAIIPGGGSITTPAYVMLQFSYYDTTLESVYAVVYSAGSTGPAGGVIEVKQSSGTPDYTNITVLIVDQATGLAIESGSSSNPVTLELLAASVSQMGAVTTGGQSFAGSKTFINDVDVGGDFFLSSSAGFGHPGVFWTGFTSSPYSPAIFAGGFAASGVPDLVLYFGNLGTMLLSMDAASGNATCDLSASTGASFSLMGSQGINATIGYNKSGGGTGTLTFYGGLLVGST